MHRSKKEVGRLLASILAFLLCLWLAAPLFGQQNSAEGIIVHSVETRPGDGAMTVDVYFTLTDASGLPLSDVNFQSATMELLGQEADLVNASIIKPDAPLYIALIIDASGSMEPAIDDVRQAAKAAIERAPANALMALYQFNESTTILERFTSDLARVSRAVDTVTTENKGTCLYDAVYQVIDELDQQATSPNERQAVILFTDGRDQLSVDSPEPCSRRSLEDVIAASQPPPNSNLPGTPIHTIGLYGPQGTDNISEPELRRMAEESGAFSAIGGRSDLPALFEQIMKGLNSQWVARADLLARQGVNQAVLTIGTQNSATQLLAPFAFDSATTFVEALPDPRLSITSVQYDAQRDIFIVGLSIANHGSVARLIGNAWDVRGGVQVSADFVRDNPEPTLQVEFGTERFSPEREYAFRFQAVDADNLLFQDEDGNSVLAEAEVEYNPAQSVAPEFDIQSVTADFDQGLVFIDLDLSGVNMTQVASYEGFMVDEETGQRVSGADFGPLPLTGSRLQLPIPPFIRDSETPQSARLTVYLTTHDGLRAEATYDDFSPVPPEPPGRLDRIWSGLVASPALLVAIVVIIGSVFVFGYVRLASRQRKKSSIPRPPVDSTQVIAPPVAPSPARMTPAASRPTPGNVAGESPTIVVEVVKATGGGQGKRHRVQSFPFTVGRADCDLNFPEDRRISRRHAEVRLRDGMLYLIDHSSNGTFLDERRLTKEMPALLSGARQVRLGSTLLRIEVFEPGDPFQVY